MNNISIFISLAASAMIIFVVIFVLVKDWRDQLMRYFAMFASSALGILFTMFLTYAFPEYFDLTQLNKITQMATLMTFSSLLTMSFVFPKPEKPFPFWITALVLLPAVAMGIAIVLTDITITKAYFKDGTFIRDYNKEFPGYTIYAATAFAYVLSAFGNVTRKYIITKSPVYQIGRASCRERV
jgi:hypothetical protein